MFASTSRTLFARSVAPQLRNGLRRGIAANVQREARRNRHLMMGGAAFIGGGLWLCLDNSKVVAETLKVDWKKLKEDIVGLLDDDNHDDGSFGPIFVRLAWHSCGTWCKHTKTGGSDGGTMRFKTEGGHGANAGLHTARARLEPLMEKYPGLSHADLYVFAGCIAIEEMGGPRIPFRPGRSEAKEESAPEKDPRFSPDGRLPDAAQQETHLRDIFYRMGFNDQEIVALSGAHALGRCHTTSSGFEGPWTRAPTTFSNEYFRELVENTWTVKKWKGPKQYEDPTGDLMMLESDMALTRDPTFKKWVEIYAKDEEKFFKDFQAAFTKLTELGLKFPPAEQAKGA
ncbi:uncharacterized protein LOC134839058 isoform X2 [Symsagittifera roscoffensis]|uniref:uncharacterized protein LOC134839058 isoform X2 n=1 Tax=Symsagittifera roscoffensis TaxID=84072 RepID=UPI00307BD427